MLRPGTPHVISFDVDVQFHNTSIFSLASYWTICVMFHDTIV
jgi:hypothetical protein